MLLRAPPPRMLGCKMTVSNPPVNSSAMALKSTTTLVAAATTISFTSLNYTADGYYKLIGAINENNKGGTQFHIYINGDTTAANYYCEFVDIAGAVTTSNNLNYPLLVYLIANYKCTFECLIFIDSGGYACYQTVITGFNGSTPIAKFTMGGKTNATVADITQIDITANNADGFASGSYISLYKVANT